MSQNNTKNGAQSYIIEVSGHFITNENTIHVARDWQNIDHDLYIS